MERRAEYGHEVIAIKQLGDLIFLKFLSIAIQRICLVVQHGFDSVSECIDGNDNALEFKGVGLACFSEPSLAKGIGLMDDPVERFQDTPEGKIGEYTCHDSGEEEEKGKSDRPFP